MSVYKDEAYPRSFNITKYIGVQFLKLDGSFELFLWLIPQSVTIPVLYTERKNPSVHNHTLWN